MLPLMLERELKPEPVSARMAVYERLVGAKVGGQVFAAALGVSRPLVSA